MQHAKQLDYMEILKLDDDELQKRLAFFELTNEDFKRLAGLKSFADRWTHDITEGLYELIMGQPETRVFFPDQATLTRVKKMQNSYFMGLFSGTCDLNYVRDRLRVGTTHERIGMAPKLYLGAYRRYLALIHQRLLEHFKGNTSEAAAALESIRKIIFFDMALAIDTYIAAYLETMTRHQAAIRELSTPVIKVYERILLLPIVGTVDTQRAHQIMETVLAAGSRTAGQSDDPRHRRRACGGYESRGPHLEDDRGCPVTGSADDFNRNLGLGGPHSRSARRGNHAHAHSFEARRGNRAGAEHHWQEDLT